MDKKETTIFDTVSTTKTGTRKTLFTNISQVNDNIAILLHQNRPFLTYEIIQNVGILSELVEAYNKLFPVITSDDVKGD